MLPRIKILLHFNQVNFKENFLTMSILASLARNNNFRFFSIPRPLGSAGAEVKDLAKAEKGPLRTKRRDLAACSTYPHSSLAISAMVRNGVRNNR